MLFEADPDDVPVTTPSGGWPRLAGALVEMAMHHRDLGETEEARRAAFDALLLLDIVEVTPMWAELSMTLGDVLLAVHEAHRARERFEAAARIFEERGDRRALAKARLGVARALLQLRDPVGRAVLEDAGSLFEELGDEEASRAIDRELREIAATFSESPASFQAVAPRRG